MKNLEELSIKGTRVSSLHQVAQILQACTKVVKLDFTYTEQTVDELLEGLKKDNISIESLAEKFGQLSGLEMSTDTDVTFFFIALVSISIFNSQILLAGTVEIAQT